MKTVRYNGHTLEMYDSIDELPITRFREYNRFVMIDAGIGSDLNDVDVHINKIRAYNGKGDKESVEAQSLNLRQLLAFVISGTSPRMSSFVALTARINDRPVDDLSNEGIEKMIKKLGKTGFTVGRMYRALDEVKKNLMRRWKRFFRALWTRHARKKVTAASNKERS